MSLLFPIINEPPHLWQPLLILQSSIAQSSIPILRQILANSLKSRSSNHFLLFSLAYAPSTILNDFACLPETVQVLDWTDSIPGYVDTWDDPRSAILSAVEKGERVLPERIMRFYRCRKAPPGSIQVVFDSVDTLCADIGYVSDTTSALVQVRDLPESVKKKSSSSPIQGPSRLILHTTRPSALATLLTQPQFSSSATLLIVHPPVLLRHLAQDYLTPPPPTSQKAKFWSVFLPVSERTYDVDRLVHGAGGEGSGNDTEIIVEILVRGSEGSGRKRGIERELEGWSLSKGPCELTKLESLRGIWGKKVIPEAAPDPTQNLSFNLNLTLSQQESRSRVPLPYAHEGKPLTQGHNATPAIFYDPDSADDIDNDDPDEDLDI
ncbi:hypothetical protein H0H81_002443 [Sphagnurus paluster]|uniref:Elongator complex protein 5 n=1 Tax=Sphagnurus paluster TaxID=117069 RepID=A0A9P7GMY7_9AGAR|nr:hypothetical protein H0H81_002443 [Sphagnurus paluster]